MSRLFALLIAVVVPNIAHAGTFREVTSSTRQTPDRSSLEVVAPAKFEATVVLPKRSATGMTPRTFALPNEALEVLVIIRAPDGTQWQSRIGTRPNQRTVLTVKFEAEAAPAKPAKKARRYIGTMENVLHLCPNRRAASIKVEFLDPETGDKVGEVRVAPRGQTQAEVRAGTFDVRLYYRDEETWRYHYTAGDVPIEGDGWHLDYGCHHHTDEPLLFIPE